MVRRGGSICEPSLTPHLTGQSVRAGPARFVALLWRASACVCPAIRAPQSPRARLAGRDAVAATDQPRHHWGSSEAPPVPPPLPLPPAILSRHLRHAACTPLTHPPPMPAVRPPPTVHPPTTLPPTPTLPPTTHRPLLLLRLKGRPPVKHHAINDRRPAPAPHPAPSSRALQPRMCHARPARVRTGAL
jgi:hypothetical protein